MAAKLHEMSGSSAREMLHEIMDYDPNTGEAFWKVRGRKHFNDNRTFNTWNSKYAFQSVGSVTPCGAVATQVFHHRYLFHRLAWVYVHGEWPEEVDHIDGDPINNKISNLRNVVHSVNMKNLKKAKNNSSGITGVRWHPVSKKWVSTIGHEGRTIYLGLFASIEDASAARKQAEKQFGFHQNHGRAA